MLVITVELWPGGDASRSSVIAAGTVANVSKLAEESDYECQIGAHGHAALGIPATQSRFTIYGHKRRDGVLALLSRVFTRSAGVE